MGQSWERLTWNRSFELGLDVLDGQHRELILIANELYSHLEGRAAYPLIRDGFERLGLYIARHMAMEEAVMQITDYPDRAAHQAEHRAFRGDALRLLHDFVDDRLEVARQGADAVTVWLYTHIRTTDRDLVKFLLLERSPDESDALFQHASDNLRHQWETRAAGRAETSPDGIWNTPP